MPNCVEGHLRSTSTGAGSEQEEFGLWFFPLGLLNAEKSSLLSDVSDPKENGDEAPEDRLTLSGMRGLPIQVRCWGLSALVVLVVVYLVYPAFPTAYGKSLAGWTWFACNNINGFLHGRFVPAAFLVMIWMAYQKTKGEWVKPNYLGLIPLALGLLFFLVSMRTIQPRVALIGAPFVVIGLAHYLFGAKVTRHVIFPAFFLWFTIPVPGLETLLTGRLQILITKSCYEVGQFFGMDLVRVGATIYVSDSPVEVANGCSGIRSLMALTMIAAVYANYTQKPLWKKALLFLSAFPLAIIANFLRVFTILVLAQFGYGSFGTGSWHDWSGLLLFFPIALMGLYLVDYLLNFRDRKRKRVKRSVKRTAKANKEARVE